MTEVISFPDGEAFLVSFLKGRVAPVKVGTKLPASHTVSDSFVRVSRTGGPSVDIVTDGGTYLIEGFAATTGAASALTGRSRSYVLAAARLSGLVRRVVDGGGLAYMPDPDSGQPKYQCLVQLDMRGQTLSV